MIIYLVSLFPFHTGRDAGIIILYLIGPDICTCLAGKLNTVFFPYRITDIRRLWHCIGKGSLFIRIAACIRDSGGRPYMQ